MFLWLKIWAVQIRAPFLLLPLALVSIAGAVAWHENKFHGFDFILTLIGVVLAHIAVNLFNEWSDYQTGIDAHTRRTPFSGGSGNLPAGLTSPASVARAAYISLGMAFLLGLYLTWEKGWILLLFMLPGGLAARFYTSHLARWAVGELAAGLGLGTLVVLGAYFVQTQMLTAPILWLSLPPGLLTALLLLLNQFPDTEADRRGGRRHLVILIGWKRSAVIYILALAACYLLLIIGVLCQLLPKTIWLTLLTLPWAWQAGSLAWRHGNQYEKMLPALAANVGVVLGTDWLIALAYLAAKFLRL